ERLAANVGCSAVLDAEGPDRARAVVAVEEAHTRRGARSTAVHVAAGDRAVALGMAVDRDRPDKLARPERRARKPRVALEHVPPVVDERPERCGGAVVDLLPVPLADVADVEIAVRAVGRETPTGAQ